jgi:DinB family protein
VHPSLAEVFARLDRSRAGLRAAVDSVPAHLRDQPPGSDRWSVAGILEHLSLVEERFTAIVASKIADARGAGLGNEEGQPALLPPHVEATITDRSERRTAPDLLHPRGLESAAAWERAEAARAAFRLMLSAADGLALSGVIHEHPRFGALNAYQWGGFLAAHESRHAEQIREIASQLASR